jgi:hypothetical protein
MTRAARLLLTLHVADAWKMHPMVFVMPLLASLWVVDARIMYARGTWGAAFQSKPGRWFVASATVLGLVLWIARFLGACGGPVPV